VRKDEFILGTATGLPRRPAAHEGLEVRAGDSAATGGWRWDLTNETPWLSPEVYGMLGIDPGPAPLSVEVVARLLGQEQLRKFIGLRERQRRDPAPFVDVVRVTRADDGQLRDVVVRGWTLHVGEDRPAQILGVCRDVTAGELPAPQALRPRRPEAVTVPATVEGVCGVDADGRITFVDRTLPTLLRSEDEDLVGRRLHDIVHRDHEGHETHSLQACPFTPEFMESTGALDAGFHRLDGSRGEIVYTLIVPPAFEGLGAIISMRDTAPRRMVTRQLQASRRQLRALNAQRGALLGHLVEAEERERLRIAAELHDDTISSLAAVALRLSTVGERARSDAERDLLADAEVEVRAAAERLRRLMVGLMTPTGSHDLVAAIADYCAVLFVGSSMSYAVEGEVGALDDVTHLLAYRLVQEAVRNALTHSGGTRVLVSVNATRSTLILRVRDDGNGMGEPRRAPTHAGLRILRGRAETAGGSARFGSGIDGRGTGIELRLPLLRSPRR
jgi:signal transduction histidine kinase